MERYTVFVDVSAKIETWDKDSVVAVSNGHSKTILFTAEIKMRSAQLVRTLSNEPVQFTLLALFTFISVRSDLDKIQSIIIDRDYSGEHADRIIKRMLNAFIKRVRPQFKAKAIKIDNIAGSSADKLAREAYRGNKKIDEVVTWEQIKEILE